MKMIDKAYSKVKRVVAYDSFKQDANFMSSLGRYLWAQRGSKTGEVFYLKDLGIPKEQIEQAKRAFQRLLLIFFVGFLVVVAYTIHAALVAEYWRCLLSAAVTVLFVAQCFKYHFWLFQIKVGKLGCTLDEWWYIGILGKDAVPGK